VGGGKWAVAGGRWQVSGGELLESAHHAANFVDALTDFIQAEVLLGDEILAHFVDRLQIRVADGQLVFLSSMFPHKSGEVMSCS